MDERREGVLDVVEQFFLLGLGAASLTKEKVEKTVDELVERGRVSREEGRKLADELTERGMAEKEALLGELGRAVRSGEIATKADVRRLEAEIAEIRAHLGMPLASRLETEDGVAKAPELADTER